MPDGLPQVELTSKMDLGSQLLFTRSRTLLLDLIVVDSRSIVVGLVSVDNFTIVDSEREKNESRENIFQRKSFLSSAFDQRVRVVIGGLFISVFSTTFECASIGVSWGRRALKNSRV